MEVISITIKAKIRFGMFYWNPSKGKWEILFSHCIYCGQRVRISKKNLRKNTFKSREFLYCKVCRKEYDKFGIRCDNPHCQALNFEEWMNFCKKRKQYVIRCSSCGRFLKFKGKEVWKEC